MANNPSQRKPHAGVGLAVYHTSEYIRHRTYIPMDYLKEDAPRKIRHHCIPVCRMTQHRDVVAKWQATAKALVFFFGSSQIIRQRIAATLLDSPKIEVQES
jgi:hypothetical protein